MAGCLVVKVKASTACDTECVGTSGRAPPCVSLFKNQARKSVFSEMWRPFSLKLFWICRTLLMECLWLPVSFHGCQMLVICNASAWPWHRIPSSITGSWCESLRYDMKILAPLAHQLSLCPLRGLICNSRLLYWGFLPDLFCFVHPTWFPVSTKHTQGPDFWLSWCSTLKLYLHLYYIPKCVLPAQSFSCY